MYIFDQDGTLYPRSSSLFQQMHEYGRRWVADRLGLDDAGVAELYGRLRAQFPNPLDGFGSVGLTADDYHRSVFDRLDVEALLAADPRLAPFLESLGEPVHVATLSSIRFSDRVLTHLGVRDMLDGRFCFPDPETGSHYKVVVYERLRIQHGLEPHQVIVVGDNFELDLADALARGYSCVLVNDAADPRVPTIPNIYNLPAISGVTW
ncbi:MAG TPA: HAD family hydrolase [Candidatus Saccharimonadia bacterium]|jgi:FMN phosphatase YigB (HAD superfamily)